MVNRRGFLALSGSVAGAMVFAGRNASAGTEPGYAAKGISAAEVAALYQRGEPSSYTGTGLRYIGMPVGGGACGQVYLGGDGTALVLGRGQRASPALGELRRSDLREPESAVLPVRQRFRAPRERHRPRRRRDRLRAGHLHRPVPARPGRLPRPELPGGRAPGRVRAVRTRRDRGLDASGDRARLHPHQHLARARRGRADRLGGEPGRAARPAAASRPRCPAKRLRDNGTTVACSSPRPTRQRRVPSRTSCSRPGSRPTTPAGRSPGPRSAQGRCWSRRCPRTCCASATSTRRARVSSPRTTSSPRTATPTSRTATSAR